MATVRIVLKNETNSGNRRGWTKVVTSVDVTKSNGYAFGGRFINDGENDLEVGSVLIQKNPMGSVKHGYDVGVCLVVRPDGSLWQTHDGNGFRWLREFLSFRDHVAAVLSLLPSDRYDSDGGCDEPDESPELVMADENDGGGNLTPWGYDLGGES